MCAFTPGAIVILVLLLIVRGHALNLANIACGESSSKALDTRNPKIFGGMPVSPGEFPWLVSIKRLHDSHFCSGIIIDRRHILSAAHCFTDFDNSPLHPSQMEVSVGELFQQSLRALSQVSVLTIHPKYDDQTKLHDIAVLKLHKNISWSSAAQPACLSDGESGNNDDNGSEIDVTGTVAGWGLTHEVIQKNNPPNELRKVQVPVWTAKKCTSFLQDRLHNYNGMGNEQICAGISSRGPCDGDSGGALMIHKQGKVQVVGIVSGRLQQACGSGSPDLYTRISHYTNWIKTLI